MSQFRSVSSNDSLVKKTQSSFHSLKSLFISSCLLLTLAACGGGGSSSAGNFDGTGGPTTPPPPPPPPPPPTPALYKIGYGSGSSYQDKVISATQTDVDAGEAITLQVNVVTSTNEVPTAEFTLTTSSPCVSSGLATLGTPTLVSAGLYSMTYTNNRCDGQDTVTARIVENGATATVNLTVHGPQVLSVSYVPGTVTQLALAGIGGAENTELSFMVSGAQGTPIVGQLVSFSINSQAGGASILAGRETGTTDAQGVARTVLTSGTIAGPVNVVATHVASGRQGLSEDITISTGVPESSRFSMSYGNFNPVGAYNTDGISVSITIIASDTFGNNPTEGTSVSFVAPESGNVVNSCRLVDGACSVTWRSTSPRPADGRVEVIAYTDGAEDYVDRNGNSVYDIGDGAFIDLPEPFADEDENGIYDLGDYFFDTNRNGVWDAGNGKWDGPCLIKVDPSAVCTGNKTVSVFETVTIVMSTDIPRLKSLGSFPAPGTPITVRQGTSISLGGLVLADNNTNADVLGGNPLPFGTTVTFSPSGAGITLQGLTTDTIRNTTSPTGFYGITVVAAPVAVGNPIPAGARLLLDIQVPNVGLQQFSWPIVITP